MRENMIAFKMFEHGFCAAVVFHFSLKNKKRDPNVVTRSSSLFNLYCYSQLAAHLHFSNGIEHWCTREIH